MLGVGFRDVLKTIQWGGLLNRKVNVLPMQLHESFSS